MRVALGFCGVRPLNQSIMACECGSTGAPDTSRFHQLFAGNTCRDEKSSSRITLSTPDPPGAGARTCPPESCSDEQPKTRASVAAANAARMMVESLMRVPPEATLDTQENCQAQSVSGPPGPGRSPNALR